MPRTVLLAVSCLLSAVPARAELTCGAGTVERGGECVLDRPQILSSESEGPGSIQLSVPGATLTLQSSGCEHSEGQAAGSEPCVGPDVEFVDGVCRPKAVQGLDSGAGDKIFIRPATSDGGPGMVAGVGLEIGVTRDVLFNGDDEQIAASQVFVAQNGFVGLGVPSPQDRLAVKGSIHATGDITAGPDGANLVELVAELQSQVRTLTTQVNAGLGHPSVAHPKSCNEIHAAEDNPPSGYYQISAPPSGVFLVWCDMRATGGWIRIGENDTSYAWIDRDEHNEDVALVTTYDLDMLQAVAASVGGFDDFDAACDIQFSMMADDSANDHRIYHRSIADLLKGGSAATGGAWPETSVHQSQGADNTRLYNRGGTCTPDPPHPSHGVSGCVPEFDEASCTSLWCTANWLRSNQCGERNMPAFSSKHAGVLFTKLEFRPRTQWAHQDGWSRNRYSLTGSSYHVYFK